MPIKSRRVLTPTLLGVAALAGGLTIFGCGGQSGGTPATQTPATGTPALTIVQPATGDIVTGNTINTEIGLEGRRIDCNLAGRPPQSGVGHYHIHLDNSLINAFCDLSASVSLQNVSPGPHTLTFVPAGNDHSEVANAAKDLPFTYRPTKPLPTITPLRHPGKPTLRIISPKPGATISGEVTIRAAFTNWRLSGDLFGKPDVAGYGHWHIMLDHLAMSSMMAMSSTPDFTVSLNGVKPGKHTIIAMLADNLHIPNGVVARVIVNVR